MAGPPDELGYTSETHPWLATDETRSRQAGYNARREAVNQMIIQGTDPLTGRTRPDFVGPPEPGLAELQAMGPPEPSNMGGFLMGPFARAPMEDWAAASDAQRRKTPDQRTKNLRDSAQQFLSSWRGTHYELPEVREKLLELASFLQGDMRQHSQFREPGPLQMGGRADLRQKVRRFSAAMWEADPEEIIAQAMASFQATRKAAEAKSRAAYQPWFTPERYKTK